MMYDYVHLTPILQKLLKIILFTFLALLVSCQGNEGKLKMEKPKEVVFKLHESFESFVKRYPAVKIERQPIGASFYSFLWSEDSPATITFDMSKYTVSFPFTISMLMMEAGYKSDEGITKFSFKSGVSYNKTIEHNEARLSFYKLLQELVSIGWKRTISLSDPRLSGSQSMHYLREHENYYSSDVSYVPTLKEWQLLEDSVTYWEFHADNKAFLKIKLERKNSNTDSKRGIYLLSIEIKDDQEMGRIHFAPEEKSNWKDQEKWDALKSKLLKVRAKNEKDLISKGYEIDESYEDFDISPKP